MLLFEKTLSFATTVLETAYYGLQGRLSSEDCAFLLLSYSFSNYRLK
jgi:hypothetical protein